MSWPERRTGKEETASLSIVSLFGLISHTLSCFRTGKTAAYIIPCLEKTDTSAKHIQGESYFCAGYSLCPENNLTRFLVFCID